METIPPQPTLHHEGGGGDPMRPSGTTMGGTGVGVMARHSTINHCESHSLNKCEMRVPHNERSCQCVRPCFAFTFYFIILLQPMYESFVERVWEAIPRNAIQCFRPCFALACHSMHHVEPHVGICIVFSCTNVIALGMRLHRVQILSRA